MRRIARTLQIRPGEGRTAGLIVTLMLLVSAGGSIGGNGIDTLFFDRFGVRYLPPMYIAVGGVMILVALGVTVLLARVSRERLFVSMPLVLAAVLVAERVLVGFGPRWVYAAIWLAMNVIGALQALSVWGLAGIACDTRQAKRLFPLFGAGGILGAVLGGLGTSPLVKLIHTENLLFVWAAALGGAFVIATFLTGSRLRAPTGPARTRRRKRAGVFREMQHGYRTVRSSPFLRWTAVAAAVFAVLMYSIAFPFSKAATAHFHSEESLAGFLGLFQGVSTGVAFLVSLFAANRLFRRFGVMRMVVAFPVIYLAGFGLLTVTSPFAGVVAFRLVQTVWLMGVYSSAAQATYNVVSPARKDQVRVFMDGIPAQAGTITAGILLLVGQEALSPRALFAIGLCAAAIAVPVTWRAMRAYGAALVDALREGRPQVFFADEQPFGGFQRDAAAVRAAIDGATSPDRAIRRVSVEILGHLSEPAATHALVRALKDRDPPVRIAALRGLVRAQAAGALLEVAGRLDDPEAMVRREALATLRALSPYQGGVVHETARLLDDEDPAVRAAAAATLLSYGADAHATNVLRAMAGDESAGVRVAAVDAIRDAQHEDGFALAANALTDPAIPVREAAARAVGAFPAERAVPLLVTTLADGVPSVRRAAGETLASHGDTAIGATAEALYVPALERGALEALQLMPAVPADAATMYVRTATQRALHYGALCRAAERAVGERTGLLADALRGRALEHAERALRGIGLLADRIATAVAIDNLASGDAAQRANALETLETAGPRELIAPLLPLWEPGEDVAGEDGERFVERALDDEDPWVRACAVAATGDANGGVDRETLERVAATDPDPLVASEAHRMLAGGSMDTLPTLSVIERVLLLRRVPLFAGLTPDDLRRVAEIATEEAFESGELLAEEGEPGDQTYVIVSGEVDVVIDRGTADEREVARHGAGANVGEMAVIQAGARSATLIAREPVRALSIDRLHFESLLRERPDVGLALMRTLVDRVRESNRLLPPELRARAEGALPRATGERRVVTMLFTDVVGSTSMAERMDPEEWADIIEDMYASLVAPVERYGGTVARFMGDAVLAFFGAPVAHDDDAERAVRAALAMIDATAPLRERLAERGLTFDIRVGLHTGLVRTGVVGEDHRIEYTALGDAVNLAARMEQTADPGTVRISEATHKLVAALFETEDFGPVTVKGRSSPTRAFRVLAAKARPGRTRGVEGLVSRLVGRDAEAAVLSGAADAVRAGDGGVVSIVGEAGLGKTRLIEEVRARWMADERAIHRWVEGRAASFDASRPYALVQQLLRGVSGIHEQMPAEQARANLAAFIDGIGVNDPDRARVAFEVVLDIEPDDPSIPLPTGEELKRDVLDAANRACRAWASRAPGVVCLDDLHWADPASLEFILHILPVAADAPVLFLCASRPEPVDVPARIDAAVTAMPERHARVSLTPLARDETATLVAELLMLPQLPDELRRIVEEKAAGNPLFVEEILRTLIDNGAVVRDERGWRVVRPADVAVPDHLHALLAARVDRIEPATRRTLQLASVIGGTFGYRVLKSISADPDDLGDHLDKLERADLIVETSERPELEFSFRHPLLQEAAYGSILIRDRRAYHAQVGEALEAAAGADAESRAATLAHHFDEAGDASRALRYRSLAGQRAASLFAHAEAVAHYRRAVDLARETGAAASEVSHLYRRLGTSLQLSGRHDLALIVYEEMESVATSTGDTAMELAAVTALATIRAIPSDQQDPTLALALLDRCLDLAARLGDRAAEARAHWNRMLVIQFAQLGLEEAIRSGERALGIARENHLEEVIAYVLHDIADSYLFVGRPADSDAALRESRTLFERLDNKTMLADALAREGHIGLVRGRFQAALEQLDRAVEIDAMVHSTWGEAYAKLVRGHVHWELGDLGPGLDDFARSEALSESASSLAKIGERSEFAVCLMELGAFDRAFGSVDAALANVSRAHGLEPWPHAAHARVLLAAGRVVDAAAALERAREKLPADGALIYFTMARHIAIARGGIALAQGDAAAALDVIEAFAEYMRGRGIVWYLGQVAVIRARAFAALGRGNEARGVLEGALAMMEPGATWGRWLVTTELSHDGYGAENAPALERQARELAEAMAASLNDPALAASFLSRGIDTSN